MHVSVHYSVVPDMLKFICKLLITELGTLLPGIPTEQDLRTTLMNRHILLSYLSVWLQGNSTVVGVQFPSWAQSFVPAAITLSPFFFNLYNTRPQCHFTCHSLSFFYSFSNIFTFLSSSTLSTV